MRQISREEFTVGSYMRHQQDLAKLEDWNEVTRQISESCDLVREITGRARVPFAFPFNGLDLPRSALAALRDELVSTDLMYDTNNLMKDRSFIVNRIWCDTPECDYGQLLHLTYLPRLAQALEPLRAIRRWMR